MAAAQLEIGTMSTKRKNKKLHKHRPDGDSVQLPFIIARAPLFQAAVPEELRKIQRQKDKFEELKATEEAASNKKFSYERIITNSYGEVCRIFSGDMLKACPDMAVYLRILARFQQYISGVAEDAIEFVSIENRQYVGFDISLSELYEITGFAAKHRDRLVSSLDRLSNYMIQVEERNSQNERNYIGATVPLRYDIIKRQKGEKSDSVHFLIHKICLPKQGKLFCSAQKCGELRTDTARLLYWTMIARSHLKATAERLYSYIHPDDKTPNAKAINEWESRRLKKAVTELQNVCGWQITKTQGEWKINKRKQQVDHDAQTKR